jgi:hypothetical protein
MTLVRTLVLLLGVSVALPGAARAATLVVAPNGVDGGSCGDKKAPCQTITRAIANAGIGDTVLVAPGRYGDVNGSLSISGADEETPNVDGCGCVLEIGKRVTVISRDGAAATVIDGGKASLHTVRISADGAVFGKKNKGFTITGGGSGDAGLNVVANDTTVTGHLFIDNQSQGARIGGSRNLIGSSRFFVKNAGGLEVTGDDNVITESAAFGSSGTTSGIGFSINGNRNTVCGVFATGNAIGISLLGSGHVVTGSVAVRNTLAAIDVAGTGTSAVITKSTMHSSGPGLANCGIVLSGMNSSAVATGNYWGAPTGPGPDPADDVCVFTNGTAVTTPFATKEHKTPTKPLR